MAIICTNNLLGNDTTGNGSPSTPYKTINKAISVAVDNDFIKVAGGEFVQVAGTITITDGRNSTLNTSVDMRGSISQYDVIAIDTSAVDGWDKEKTLYTVESIGATQIFVTNQPTQLKVGTYNIWRLNAYHYSSASSTSQETITSIPANNLTISGGWSSDFTTQIGWTCARTTTATVPFGSFLTLTNLIKPSVVFDKFLMARTSFNHTSSSGSIGIGTVSFVYSMGNTFGTSNYGIYNPSEGATTLIACTTQLGSGFWNGAGNRPTQLLLNQYITATFAATTPFTKTGYILSLGQSTGPVIRTNNLYCRTSGTGSNFALSAFISSNNVGDVFIDYMNLTVNNNGIISIYNGFSNDTSWRYVGNIDVQTDGTNAGIIGAYQSYTATGDVLSYPFNINRTSGKLDALPWRIYGTLPEISMFYRTTNTVIYGKDIEGYKTITEDNITRYADPTTYVTGSNSLRQKLLTNTAGGDTIRHMLGTMLKPNTPFTINITMKGSKNIPSSFTSFSLLYGPATSQVLTIASNPTITTDWTTFSYTVDPASYPLWSFGDDGLMSIFYNASSLSTTINDEDYFWVDSITIT